MASWSIGRRQPSCAACERAFDDGERHYSRILIRDDALVRADSCWRCFRPEEAEGDVFWWRTRYVARKKRGLQLNLAALETLFASLEGRTETAVRELRYLLCLLLMRKRRLKLVRIRRDREGESFEVRRPRRQETQQVFVFDFTPERMEELRSELVQLFDEADVPEGDAQENAEAEDSPEPAEPEQSPDTDPDATPSDEPGPKTVEA